MELRSILASAVEEASVRDRVTDTVAESAGVDHAAAEAAVAAAAEAATPTAVEVATVGEDGDTPASIRAVLASGQLTLFIFLTTLTGASYLLSTRQLGVTRRMRAGPVPIPAIVAGEAVGTLRHRPDPGGDHPRRQHAAVRGRLAGAGRRGRLLCVAMSLVGTGAAMLLGTLGRSEQQVGALALLLSLVLAALGGSMQPLEFFPDTLRTVAFLTPHAWMNDAMWRILVDGDGAGPGLGVASPC